MATQQMQKSDSLYFAYGGSTHACTQTITTSCYDVVVIRHKNHTLKSTPFQAVFAERSLKRDPKKAKLKDLQLFVNEELIDIPMRLDPNNGRVQFQKVTPPLTQKYVRRTGNISDSSDISDD